MLRVGSELGSSGVGPLRPSLSKHCQHLYSLSIFSIWECSELKSYASRSKACFRLQVDKKSLILDASPSSVVSFLLDGHLLLLSFTLTSFQGCPTQTQCHQVSFLSTPPSAADSRIEAKRFVLTFQLQAPPPPPLPSSLSLSDPSTSTSPMFPPPPKSSADTDSLYTIDSAIKSDLYRMHLGQQSLRLPLSSRARLPSLPSFLPSLPSLPLRSKLTSLTVVTTGRRRQALNSEAWK